MTRCDETWHRLLEWTYGQAPSERLAAQVLLRDGFTSLDPGHPLGGKDGGQDATCVRNGQRWAMAAHFPRGQQDFTKIQKKFRSDLKAVREAGSDGIAFVTNQELRLAERHQLREEWPDRVELFHLERVSAMLDTPEMAGVRRQFLGIEDADSPGRGGNGGGGTIRGNRGTVIGGRGGAGGTYGRGGDGGSGVIEGDDGTIVGGDGGSAGTGDGRGGRAAAGPFELEGGATGLWRVGSGGAGANAPEYNRRLTVLSRVRREYLDAFPEREPFVDAGVDSIPALWVNKRLEELGEPWRVRVSDGQYVLPPLHSP